MPQHRPWRSGNSAHRRTGIQTTAAALGAFSFAAVAAAAEAWGRAPVEPLVHHSISATLDPESRSVAVSDALAFPEEAGRELVLLLLDARLTIARAEPPVREIPLGELRPCCTRSTPT